MLSSNDKEFLYKIGLLTMIFFFLGSLAFVRISIFKEEQEMAIDKAQYVEKQKQDEITHFKTIINAAAIEFANEPYEVTKKDGHYYVFTDTQYFMVYRMNENKIRFVEQGTAK